MKSPLKHLTACLASIVLIAGCGSGTTTTTTTTTTTSTNPYVVAYKAASWGNTMTVTYPSSCTMSITTTGKPNYTPNPYYLGIATGNATVVAHLALSNTAMMVIDYATTIAPALKGSTATLNICPAKAATTTVTSPGAIGYLISGAAMFNPFEMDQVTPAVADNASYTFTDTSGATQTAYFLDLCGTHSNGSTWHDHANPICVTSQVDTATGPSHIIGVALDGFPIYGGRDINGSIITVAQLDACNGITSPTPEFPSGAYHYVMPIGVTTKYAAINCYSGTVSTQTMAAAKKLACDMRQMMLAWSKETQPAKPQQMPTMARGSM